MAPEQLKDFTREQFIDDALKDPKVWDAFDAACKDGDQYGGFLAFDISVSELRGLTPQESAAVFARLRAITGGTHGQA